METALLNGAFIGLVYGMFAVGLVVVYRGARVVNFAHGQVGMIAAFVFLELWNGGIGRWPALLIAILLGACIGAAVERLVARPLRTQPPVSLMVATFGVANLILVFAVRRYGVAPRYVESLVQGSPIEILGLAVQPIHFVIIGVSLCVMLGLTAVYRFTRFGLQLRAAAIDPEAASQVGININTVSIATWALAGAIAAVSAILIAPLFVFTVTFMAGFMIRGLAAAVIGGLTNVGGAFMAGVALGIGEGALRFQLSAPGIVEVVLAALIIVTLLVRPTGLFSSQY